MYQKKLAYTLLLSSTVSLIAYAQELHGKEVTTENFIRAESDRYFYATEQIAGGINRFGFHRGPISLKKQTIMRMNLDILYGAAVIDTRGGASITFPQIPDHRYVSVFILDNDHNASMVIYEPGTYPLPEKTRYVLAAVRVHVPNPEDHDDLKKAAAIQDMFKITAHSSEPFPKPEWDKTSLDKLRITYEKELAASEHFPDDWQGRPSEVNRTNRHIAAVGAWGLLPDRDAYFLNYNGHLSDQYCYTATYQVPKNNGFWSMTMYGQDGYIKSGNSLLNDANVQLNADGQSFDAYFGSEELCGNQPNRLDTSAGWNFLMRIYRADESVLNGHYVLPQPHEIEK